MPPAPPSLLHRDSSGWSSKLLPQGQGPKGGWEAWTVAAPLLLVRVACSQRASQRKGCQG